MDVVLLCCLRQVEEFSSGNPVNLGVVLFVHELHEVLKRRAVFREIGEFVAGGYSAGWGEAAAVLVQVCPVSADEDLIGGSEDEVDPYATIFH